MKNYNLHIHETNCGDVSIDAESIEQARSKYQLGEGVSAVNWDDDCSDVEGEYGFEVDEDGEEVEGTREDW